MKKFFFGLAISFMMFLVIGCGNAETKTEEETTGLRIVTTVFPLYDWTKNIIGETGDVSLTMLLDEGIDLHSYQPTAQDLLEIGSCDLFIYVGGESDQWVEDAFKNGMNRGAKTLNLLSILKNPLTEEEIPGAEAEEEEAYDEHVWLSLRNAEECCEAIKDALLSVDPEKKEIYQENCGRYREKLAELDGEFTEISETDDRKVLLFADRFPFLYFAKDYGYEYYAAFSGCSAESEAGFETIKFLSDKLNEYQLKSVFILEGASKKIAETVIAGSGKTDVTIRALNSIQTVTAQDVRNGADYLAMMKENLEVLKEAFRD